MESHGIDKSDDLIKRLNHIQAQSTSEADFMEQVLKLVVGESLSHSREINELAELNLKDEKD